MLLERSFDYPLIRSVMVNPSIYSRIVDDFCPSAEDFQPVQHDSILYVTVRDQDELLGLFMLVPQNGITLDIHTCLLPCAYGTRAALAAYGMAEWIWTNTRCQRIVTTVPKHNRLALRFALSAGMQIFGTNQSSFMYHAKIEDQTMLGLSRPKGK